MALKSVEQMARDMVEAYMRPLIIAGMIVHHGWPLEIAARKAAAAHPNFKDAIAKFVQTTTNQGEAPCKSA